MFTFTKYSREQQLHGGRATAAVAAVLVIVAVIATGTESAAVAEPSPVTAPTAAQDEAPRPTPPPPNTLAPEPAAPRPGEATPTGGSLRIVPDPRSDERPVETANRPPAGGSTIAGLAYGPHEDQRLDLHLPAEGDAPLVVYIHGGGWVGGDRIHVPDFVLQFVERGYAVASVSYRLAPDHPFPAPVHDIKLAVRWLKAFAVDNPHVDTDRIVLIGASAGGHLATFTAATVGSFEPAAGPELAGFDSSVAAVVAVVGPTDLTTFYGHDHPWAAPLTEAFVGCSPCTTASLAEASPTTHLHPDVPPAYFAVGALDDLVDIDTQGILTAEAWLQAAGPGSVWLDVVEDRGHNLDDGSINQRSLGAFVDRAVGRGR